MPRPTAIAPQSSSEAEREQPVERRRRLGQAQLRGRGFQAGRGTGISSENSVAALSATFSAPLSAPV